MKICYGSSTKEPAPPSARYLAADVKRQWATGSRYWELFKHRWPVLGKESLGAVYSSAKNPWASAACAHRQRVQTVWAWSRCWTAACRFPHASASTSSTPRPSHLPLSCTRVMVLTAPRIPERGGPGPSRRRGGAALVLSGGHRGGVNAERQGRRGRRTGAARCSDDEQQRGERGERSFHVGVTRANGLARATNCFTPGPHRREGDRGALISGLAYCSTVLLSCTVL